MGHQRALLVLLKRQKYLFSLQALIYLSSENQHFKTQFLKINISTEEYTL